MDLFDAMHTQRAVRRFKPDAVPPEAVSRVLAAATRAPSGGNSQPWSFVVLRDADVRRQVGNSLQGRLGCGRRRPTHQRPRPGQGARLQVGEVPGRANGRGARPHPRVYREWRSWAVPDDRRLDLSGRSEPDAGGARPGTGYGDHDHTPRARAGDQGTCLESPRA